MYALYSSIKQGIEVIGVVYVVPEKSDSWLFHFPNARWVRLQAEAMRMPSFFFSVKGGPEEELSSLTRFLSSLKENIEFDSLIYGVIASRYQKSRLDRMCEKIGISPITPLWGRDPISLLKEIVSSGFKTIIVSVSALGLDERWLGRLIDERAIEEIVELHRKYGIHPCFEGGEAETFVLDCPLFEKSIEIVRYSVVKENLSAYLVIEEARLRQKYG